MTFLSLCMETTAFICMFLCCYGSMICSVLKDSSLRSTILFLKDQMGTASAIETRASAGGGRAILGFAKTDWGVISYVIQSVVVLVFVFICLFILTTSGNPFIRYKTIHKGRCCCFFLFLFILFF